MKMILTRVGENSKIVVTGDVHQRDTRNDCGLYDASVRFDGLDGFGVIRLYDRSDVVRNDKTSEIIERYEETNIHLLPERPEERQTMRHLVATMHLRAGRYSFEIQSCIFPALFKVGCPFLGSRRSQRRQRA